MKLQKQVSRKMGDKEYSKYVLVLSSRVVKEIGWKGGEEIGASVEKESLILKAKK